MAKIADIRKCHYGHCKHLTNVISLLTDDYVEENGKYYHTDCKHEKDVIAAIIDYWYKHIDPDVIFNQLVKVINNIVYRDKVDCDFLLWALKQKAKYLKHPPGLVYAIKDKQLQKQYEFEKKLVDYNNNKDKVGAVVSNEPVFTYKEGETKKKFGDIFGGN